MVLEDKNLVCVDCGESFSFTADEQRYHSEKGFQNEPKRCVSCRQARRAERTSREMHPVVCDECGTNTEVPFKPRGDRPVYCDDCFSKRRESAAI